MVTRTCWEINLVGCVFLSLPQRQVESKKKGREYGEFLSRVRECDGEMETEERLMCSEGERE